MALGVCCYISYIMYQVANPSCVARDLRHAEGGGSRSRRRSAERVRSDEPEGCRYVYCAVKHWHGEYRMGCWRALFKCFLQNTYSTALLIGEKAAMIIAEDLGIDCTACPSWWK